MRSGHAPTLTATIPCCGAARDSPSAPVVVSPAAYEISFGRVIGRVGAGTTKVVVSVDGRVVARKDVGRTRFDFAVLLPARDVRLTIRAVDERARGLDDDRSRLLAPSDRRAARAAKKERRGSSLARTIRSLARAFPGICGVYVQDLRTGAGAAWNAGARFPAASTVKVAIAIEVLPGSAEAAAAAGSTCCSARRSSRPTTGRPTTCSPGSAARRAAAPRM